MNIFEYLPDKFFKEKIDAIRNKRLRSWASALFVFLAYYAFVSTTFSVLSKLLIIKDAFTFVLDNAEYLDPLFSILWWIIHKIIQLWRFITEPFAQLLFGWFLDAIPPLLTDFVFLISLFVGAAVRSMVVYISAIVSGIIHRFEMGRRIDRKIIELDGDFSYYGPDKEKIHVSEAEMRKRLRGQYSIDIQFRVFALTYYAGQDIRRIFLTASLTVTILVLCILFDRAYVAWK